MSSEGERQADLLVQLSALLESERNTRLGAQENERKAIISALEALRNVPPAKPAGSRTGRFVQGFLLGAVLGTAAVLMMTPKSGSQNRESLRKRLEVALAAAREATSAREKELWDDYRKRLAGDPQQGNKGTDPFPYDFTM